MRVDRGAALAPPSSASCSPKIDLTECLSGSIGEILRPACLIVPIPPSSKPSYFLLSEATMQVPAVQVEPASSRSLAGH
ncbi:hypothetical protein V8E51_009711 [Hyaloscypha variabilis]